MFIEANSNLRRFYFNEDIVKCIEDAFEWNRREGTNFYRTYIKTRKITYRKLFYVISSIYYNSVTDKKSYPTKECYIRLNSTVASSYLGGNYLKPIRLFLLGLGIVLCNNCYKPG